MPVCGNLRRAHVVRRDRDRRPRVRAVRSRQRRAAVRAAGDRAPRARHAADVSHLHVARALGPHHGVPVLHSGVHPGQPHPHLRRPSGPRGGAAPPARRAVVSGGFRGARRDHRVRAAGAGNRPPDRRHDGAAAAAAARRRFLRLPLHVGGPQRRLHDRLRAQARRPGGDRALRRLLPRCRRRDLRRDVFAGRSRSR